MEASELTTPEPPAPPARVGPPEPEPTEQETEMAESTETAGAVDEWAAATAAEAARVAAEEATNDHVNAVRAEMRAAYNDSDAGVAAAQHREAARIMSLPTPHALDEIGSVVGDPTLGPAS